MPSIDNDLNSTSRLFQLFFYENKCSPATFRFLIETLAINEGLPTTLSEFWRSFHCERFHCLYLKNAAMHEVNYNGRESYVSYNCLYCRIRPEGFLCNAERDLLAIAKFLVQIVSTVNIKCGSAFRRTFLRYVRLMAWAVHLSYVCLSVVCNIVAS